jgi:hypothetical protein
MTMVMTVEYELTDVTDYEKKEEIKHLHNGVYIPGRQYLRPPPVHLRCWLFLDSSTLSALSYDGACSASARLR